MKITNYKQLDKLVAESLDWVCDLHTEIGEDFQEVETEWYHPESIDIEFDDWIIAHGTCPNFSTQWEDTKFILDECDRQDCLIELVRKEATTCQIRPKNPELWSSKDFMPVTTKSISLAVCLAWLKFKNIEVEFEPNESI